MSPKLLETLRVSRFDYEASLSGKWHTVAADLRGNFLIVGDDRHQLTQFHFHRPREECIHGKPYDMGLHLMHKSSDGKVAGVAVLLQADSASATIRQVWQPMPTRAKSRRLPASTFIPRACCPATPPIPCTSDR